MKKRTAIGLIAVSIVVGLLLSERSSRFIEIRSTHFNLDYYHNNNIQWVDERYLLIASGFEFSLWDVIEGTKIQTYTSPLPNPYRYESILVSPISQTVAIIDDGVLHVWNLFEVDPFFVWDGPRGAACEWVIYRNNFGTSTNETELLIGCWNQNGKTVYNINIATNEVIPYLDQKWSAVDPFAAHVVFGFDEATSMFYALDIMTEEQLWSTSIDDQEYIYVDEITNAAILACGRDVCFLLNRQTGALQKTIEFDHLFWHAYLFNDQVVTIGKVGPKVTIQVKDTSGARLRQVEFDLPISARLYSIITHLSSKGELAISFYPETHMDIFEDISIPVYIYDIATLDRIATLNSHTDTVIDLSFDPTGTYLFVGSLDDAFRIWKIRR